MESYLEEYREYIHSLGGYSSGDLYVRDSLQKKTTLVSRIVYNVNNRSDFILQKQKFDFHEILAFTLLDGSNLKDMWDSATRHVIRTLNESIGNIENDTIPLRKIEPVLPIKDSELKSRCLPLLRSPGKFDTSVREATLILENRLRNSLEPERLATMIPESANLTFENVINALLNPSAPILIVSTEKKERAAFQRIMLGVCSYLRNPFHHMIDDSVEWSWAWSIIGLIDHLLFELSSCEINKENVECKK